MFFMKISRQSYAKKERNPYICNRNAVVAQLVEHQLPKLRVTSSSLAYRSIEKEEVTVDVISSFLCFSSVGIGFCILIMYIFAGNKVANMETVLKRKNIDLPVDTLRKLSVMAMAQGRSLKSFIEGILISKANSSSIEVEENPSPSGDEWFNDPKNLKEVNEGIAEMKAGKGKVYSMDEIKSALGI